MIQWAGSSAQAAIYRQLADDIVKNECLNIPEPLTFEELEELVAKYGNQD